MVILPLELQYINAESIEFSCIYGSVFNWPDHGMELACHWLARMAPY